MEDKKMSPESEKVLTLQQADVLNVLLEKIPNFSLGGSLSMVAWGVLKRPIGDIDIVVNDIAALKNVIELEFVDVIDYEMEEVVLQNSEIGLAVRYLEERKVNHVRLEVNGVKVCAFISKSQGKEETKTVTICGQCYEVNHPKYAVEAKKNYVQRLLDRDDLSEVQNARLKKHITDIWMYHQWISDNLKIQTQV